uniref:Metalloendopeptidase n=1 Tax=Romanomermis culicivorax TaxID=13658 RepID=A0A915HX03_ROMCU
MTIGRGCGVSDTMHEMMHALGFMHENERDDSQKFITIHEQNIVDLKNNAWLLDKQKVKKKWRKLLPYDYNSLMHYVAESYSTGHCYDNPYGKEVCENAAKNINHGYKCSTKEKHVCPRNWVMLKPKKAVGGFHIIYHVPPCGRFVNSSRSLHSRTSSVLSSWKLDLHVEALGLLLLRVAKATTSTTNCCKKLAQLIQQQQIN